MKVKIYLVILSLVEWLESKDKIMKKYKFLLDNNIEESIFEFLLSKKHDVVKIREIDREKTDLEIIKLGISEKRFILTNDREFLNYFNQGHKTFGIILFKVIDLKSKNQKEYYLRKITVLNGVLEKIKLIENKLLVVEINFLNDKLILNYVEQ